MRMQKKAFEFPEEVFYQQPVVVCIVVSKKMYSHWKAFYAVFIQIDV